MSELTVKSVIWITIQVYMNQSARFQDFCSSFPEKQFLKGELVIAAHEEPHSLFYIEKGCIKLCALGIEGQDVPFHIFYPGSCVSLFSLMGEKVPYDFRALTAVSVRVVPKEKLKEVLATDSALSNWMLHRTLKGMMGLLKRLERRLTQDAYQLVAGVLLYFESHKAELMSDGVPVKVTHQIIADWLGLSRENVSLQMKKLEVAGYLQRDENGIKVVQPSALASLVGEN